MLSEDKSHGESLKTVVLGVGASPPLEFQLWGTYLCEVNYIFPNSGVWISYHVWMRVYVILLYYSRLFIVRQLQIRFSTGNVILPNTMVCAGNPYLFMH